MRSSLPPIPEDVRRRAINRAHADAQKKRKDAKAAKRTKQILMRKEPDKRRHQQRKDGLPLEESPSPSLSMEASDGDDEGEVGRGHLDHLPDVVEVAPGALASSLALPGGGGEADPGSVIARSTAMVEQVAVEATPPPLQRTKGTPGSVEDQPAPMDMEAMPLPPPPPLRMRIAMAKRLPPRSR